VTNKIVKVFFLAAGLVMTGHAILTPLLMVISMLGGDLLGMSVTTDNVRPSPSPNSWRIRQLTIAGVFMGISELIFCIAVLAVGRSRLGPGVEPLRTLAFVILVFGNQAAMYLNRDRRRLGSSRPSRWLLLSSAVDVLSMAALAVFGIAMAPLPVSVVIYTFLAAAVFALVLDFAKVPVFRRLRIA
jgi:H+-transporting ATPase